METLDLKKMYKSLYNPSAKKVELVQVPDLAFLMVDGAIEPGQGPGTSTQFQENMQALYGMAYTLKFMFKQRPENPVDYPVMAMEGLWWVEDGNFDINIKDNWFYTVMIMLPDIIRQEDFDQGLAKMRKKKGDQPGFGRLRLARFEEGLAVQTMHIGPYASEPETVARMHAFMAENGLEPCGKHHEIYMGNPLLADPSKLKTILRHPAKKK